MNGTRTAKLIPLWVLTSLLSVTLQAGEAPQSKPSATVPATTPPRHVKLPDSVDQVCPGRGGKMLVLHLKKLQQLALFDVEKSKVVKYLPMPAGEVVFAAGAEKLFVGLTDLRQVQRWDLAGGKLELTVPAPEGGIGAIAIGADSVGPVVLLGDKSKRCWLIDPKTMQATKFPSKNWGTDGSAWGPVHIHASFDGSAVVANGGGWAGMELTTFAGGRAVDTVAGGYVGDEVLISGNGSLVFPDGKNILRSDLASKISGIEGTMIPAIDPGYSAALQKDNTQATLTVFSNSDPRALLTLRNLPELAEDSKLPIWQRVNLIPSAKALVTVNGDELIVRKFDLADELAAGGIDYLFVESSPPASAAKGETLTYQIQVRSKKGGVKYDLQASPPGMTLGADGKLQWAVPKDFAEATASVIVQIADSAEQAIFHSFVLRVTGSAPASAGAGGGPAGDTPGVATGPGGNSRRPHQAHAPAQIPPPAEVPARAEPASDDAPSVFKLDEPFHEFHAAAGGRTLVFYEQSARKLVLYETATGKEEGSIPIGADDARFACGLDCVVVVLPAQKIIQRYSLRTLKREKTMPLPGTGPFREVRMGNAAVGPIYLYCGAEILALNPTTLAPMKVRGSLPAGEADGGLEYRVSADNGTVVWWNNHTGQTAFEIMHLKNGIATNAKAAFGWDRGGRQFTPSADGSLVIASKTFWDGSARPFADDSATPSLKEVQNFVPTSDPRFLFAVQDSGNHTSKAALCARTDRRVLMDLPNLPDVGNTSGFDGLRCGIVFLSPVTGEPRLIYLPDEGVVAAIPVEADRFVVLKVDLDGEMVRSGTAQQQPGKSAPGAAAARLAVVSVPPSEVALGGTFSYRVQVLPAKAQVKVQLESGPPGLTVSTDGVVTWKPTERPIGGQVSVILSISDAAGEEIPHAFDIEVVRDAPPSEVAGAGPSERPEKPTVHPAATAPATRPAEAQKPRGSIVKANDHYIELPTPDCRYVPGRGGHVLVLAGKQLAILASDGFTITSSKTLPKSYLTIGERETYYVALCQEPREIDLIDKQTLKVIKMQPVGLGVLTDLVLHPTRPISYVSYQTFGKGFTHHYLMFDESKVDARTDDNWIGEWLAIAPDGKFLLTGTQEIYQDGHDIIDNPDRTWVVPRYASLDSFARYDLSAQTGVPLRVAHKENVGGGGLGIRLAPGGTRFTYLSNAGSPSGSNNLAGWDPLDLSKLPIPYVMRDIATCHDLAFHPILPLVASYGKDGVVVYNRDTGEQLEKRVDADLADKTVSHLYFSPDGRSVILQIAVGEIPYLYHVPLKLSAEELKTVSGLPRPDRKLDAAPATPPEPAEPHKLPEARAEAPGAENRANRAG